MKNMTLALALTVTATAFSYYKPYVIYGLDNRIDSKDIKNQKAKDASKAIAAQVSRLSYKKELSGSTEVLSFDNLPTLSDPWGGNVCRSERFSKQAVLASCSGFLVGPKTLVTAGHCLLDDDGEISNSKNANCTDNDWLFGYEVSKSGKFDAKNVPAKNLYKCNKVIIAKLNNIDDFAIIELDRTVEGVKPLQFRKHGKISTFQSLYVIGHPSGLPKKFADGARVLNNSAREFFATSLDTFGGNSGSPVFNKTTHKVEGILVRGKTDYIPTAGNCFRVNICSSDGKHCLEEDEGLEGEEVSRITEILNYL